MFTLFVDGGEQIRLVGVYTTIEKVHDFIADDRAKCGMTEAEGWVQTTVDDNNTYVHVHLDGEDHEYWTILYTIVPTTLDTEIGHAL